MMHGTTNVKSWLLLRNLLNVMRSFLLLIPVIRFLHCDRLLLHCSHKGWFCTLILYVDVGGGEFSISEVGRNWISNLSFKDSIVYVIPNAFSVICDEHKTVPFILSSPFLGSSHFLPYPENVFTKVLHIVFAVPCLQTPNQSEHVIT
jgi:hypothetical protein